MDASARLVPDTLIYVDEAERSGGSGRALQAACRRGVLVRVRRGAYCPRELWDELEPAARHQLAIHAVTRGLRGPYLVSGRSAGAVWGIPFAASEHDEVELLVPYHGGGASEPGARRTCIGFDTARVSLVGGIPFTDRARTALDVMRVLPFSRAVAVADHVQSRRRDDPLPFSGLEDELVRAGFTRGGPRARLALGFSTSLSDSVGESECRAAIHLAGFEPPLLQRRWHDREGWMETDFYWEQADVVGEFDGRIKYTRDELTGGDPSAVVWREKRREDRLRRQVSGVVRLVTDEFRRPAVLAATLDDAGVPRRDRRVVRRLGTPWTRLQRDVEPSKPPHK